MSRSFRLLLGTHMIVFVTGFAIGKLIDYDELQQYRSSYEGRWTRIRRQVTGGCVALVSIGAVTLIAKAISTSKK